MSSKIERIKELLHNIDPNLPLQVETKEDGSSLLIGPYPSFIFTLDQGDAPDGFIVSVNSDAPNVVYFLMEIIREFPDLQHYGPYGEIPETGDIVFHEEAYQIKEDNILAQGVAIAQARAAEQQGQQPGILVPEEKKLIIPGA